MAYAVTSNEVYRASSGFCAVWKTPWSTAAASTTSADAPNPSPCDTAITAVPPSATALPVHQRRPAEPVTRQIFTVSRRGGDRKPAVRVVLDALTEAAQDLPAAA